MRKNINLEGKGIIRANKKNILAGTVVLVLLAVLGTAATFAGNVVYVDDSAIGANDGTSWADAYNYLQDALAHADTTLQSVEIRVAQGIYTPDQGGGIAMGDRLAVFQLISDVTIYRGFAGAGAAKPDARNIEEYKTILSGDLAGDDADVDNPADLANEPTRVENSLVIVSGNNTHQRAVLDGVTITSGLESCMTNNDGEPTVNNCIFLNAWVGLDSNNGCITHFLQVRYELQKKFIYTLLQCNNQ